MCFRLFYFYKNFPRISKSGFFFSHQQNYYYHHHHHVMPLARISLTLSRHFSLSFITSGRSSGLHPVSSHSCCMYVRAGQPAFTRPYVRVHRSTSLISSSLLLQQCPACLVRLTLIVFVLLPPGKINTYIYIYIYIYGQPQTDSFVESQLFSVARHVERLKLGSKAARLYVRLRIIPLSQQANHVSSGIIRHYVVPFVCLRFRLTGQQSAPFVRRALHYVSGSCKLKQNMAHTISNQTKSRIIWSVLNIFDRVII